MPPMSLLVPVLNILVLSATIALGILGWATLEDHGGRRALDDPDLWRDGRVWITLAGFALLAGGGRWLVLALLGHPDRAWARPVAEGEVVPVEDGSRIYVERPAGRAAAVTLVWTHGWGLDATIWAPLMERLGDHATMVWDLPGLGRSRSGGSRAIGPEAFAGDLDRLLDETAGPLVLIGHSIGGMALQSWLGRHPARERVAGLVLLNTTPRMPLRTMVLSPLLMALERPLLRPMMRLTILLRPIARIMAWQGYWSGTTHLANRLGFGRRAGRHALDHVSRLTTRNDPAVQARGNLAMFDWDSGDAVAGWSGPLLVIAGADDLVTRSQASRDLAAMAADSRLVVVPEVGHLGFLEASETYAAAIRAFVAERAVSRDVAGPPAASSDANTTDPWLRP